MSLMSLSDADMEMINQGVHHPETGMNFQLILTVDGPIAVLANGFALPCYQTDEYFSLSDLLAGKETPQPGEIGNFQLPANYCIVPGRAQAQAAIATAAKFAAAPHPLLGAHPLMSRHALAVETSFLRYISSSADRRFTGMNLLPRTYLTTKLEAKTATSGFAAVGRFSLPLPMPACTVIEYKLPAHSVIEAGTVAPLFGQSGGGVEICVVSSPSALQIPVPPVPQY